MGGIFHNGRRSLELVGAGILLLATAVGAAAQQAGQPFNERPAEAGIVMSTSNGKYDGSYESSLLARVCGEVPGELNFAGVPAFLVQYYPDDGQGPITDITFDSKELVGGITQSSVFFLSVIVQSPTIGRPAAYVLNTAQPGMQGTATLAFPEPGTLELKVDGVNDRGETVRLSLRCLPKA
jgi:hypothetical protein